MFDPHKSHHFAPFSLYVSENDFNSKDVFFDRAIRRDSILLLFLVPQQSHYAYVQIEITPLYLKKYPEQVFYTSTARYKTCCRVAEATGFGNALHSTAQKVYDSSFQFQYWDF